MGIFDRIRDAVGGEAEEERPTEPPDPGVDRGVGSGRVGADDDRKTGSHGSHWDAVTANNAEVRDAVVAAVQEGETREGVAVNDRAVTAHVHPTTGPIRTVALSVDDEIVTAFPVADGVTHEVLLERVTEWANDVEAQVEFALEDNRMAAFDTGFFYRGWDWYDLDERIEMDLAALAYDLGPVEDEAITDEDGNEFDPSGVAAFMQFDGGDVDDYVFQTTVSGVERHEYLGRTVHRIRAPLFREDGRDVEVAIYAAEHMTGGYVPETGDDVEGVIWLQGRAV